jgi:hypothetical protein
MKSFAPTRLRPLAIAIAAATLGGCTVWPGSRLPTAPDLAKKAAAMPLTDGCAQSTPEAVRCARYLSSVLAKVESDTGNWDTWYSIGSVAAGTLAAIYLKSDTDRTQALEDLAVTVAALAGIRGVLKPDDRRRIAREGRQAVDCMIAAAEGITTYAEEAKKADVKKNQEVAEIAARTASARLEDAERDLSEQRRGQQQIGLNNNENNARLNNAKRQIESARQIIADSESRAAQPAISAADKTAATAKVEEARKSLESWTQEQQRISDENQRNKENFEAAGERVNQAQRNLDVARSGVDAAKVEVATAAVRAANKPLPKLNATLDREFGISAALQRGAPRQQRDGDDGSDSVDANRLATGVLLQRQVLEVQSAQEKANKSAEVAEAMLPKTLAYGVYEVLNHVRGSIADLASASEDLAKTQRDTVNGLIADLKAKADAEAEAATKLEGASAATPVVDPARPAEAQDAVDSTKTPAKRKIVTVFNQCVAPAS